ncbi:DNA-binding transcriptional LysR family regulator [Yoonia maricola]|uniref:DNA-binding transcriptional LysR family regulator n=1 Tax=Yoonia maricola TaxID=420999 RepID=A0A2M8WNW3_9RHOB|nr:LysR family transcriptional regulator [Yoonia maricola]PJI92625.1 DNA-binding transcriptional LysR family regulator [Yoonia maricola]
MRKTSMRLNLKQLEAFVWVADLQSFRRAAERLNTTQPNISARIAGLEQALGTTLMTRDAGSVRLTGKGQELLAHARRVLDATDALIVAADQKALIEGTLRLGVTEMIVHTWLRAYLRRLKEVYPRLTVELTVDFSVNLEKGLAERSLDLALQNEPFSRLATGQRDIGPYELIWIASPDLGLAASQTIETLAAQPILTHARDTRLYEEVAAHFGARRDLTPRLVPSTNLAACQTMTIDGMGIAVLPAAMVAQDIASGSLVKLAYDWTPEPLHFFARYDEERAQRFVAEAAMIAVQVAKDQ